MSKSEKRRTPPQKVATIMREARLARGLSIKQIADTSGVSRSMLHKIEAGERTPGAAVIKRLSDTLGASWYQNTLDVMMNDLVERTA